MKMKPIIRDFLTGVVALFGLAGIIIMLILFGELADTGKKFYHFKIHAASAGGLSTTSIVTLNGVKVGQVTSTTVIPPPANGAEIGVKIYEGVRIPKAAQVSIDRSFVGDASLEFQIPPDVPASALTETIDPDSVFEAGEAASTLQRIASSIQKPLNRFGETAAKIDRLADTYTEVGERINQLLEPRTLAEVQAGKEPNIRSTIARADKALADASSLLSDEQLVADAKRVIAKANTTMDEVSSLAKAWTKTAVTVDSKIDSLTVQATTALRATEKAAGELALTLETVNKGQGTMGQLIQNPDLYNSLRDAAARLDRALVEVQMLVEKYRAEGIPLRL
jgi:phospholipid/cholesterol/gamma-HCH transport system substrate-binding protein